MKNNHFTSSNFDEVFGRLESVHRLKRGFGEMIFLPGVVFFVGIFGIITYIASEDWLTLPLCVAPSFLMFGLMLRHLFSTRKDELRIYENGFTHQSGKKLQTCRWQDIKTYHRRELNNREIVDLENGEIPLGSIVKKTGEIITFDQDLPGTTEIIRRFENRGTKNES